MNELALFAGAGGGILGTRLLGWRVVCAVEINPYCREVLLRRQEEGILNPFPIWDDIKTFDGTEWRGKVDVITAGFPCQPWSTAGYYKKEDDERNLWPDTLRIIREVRPRYCLLENVPSLLTNEYFGEILSSISKIGYSARWKTVSAAELGAPHRRNRIWIFITNSDMVGWFWGSSIKDLQIKRERIAKTIGCKDGFIAEVASGYNIPVSRAWSHKPPTERVVNELPYQLDRLRAIGEGQVPTVVETAWKILNTF